MKIRRKTLIWLGIAAAVLAALVGLAVRISPRIYAIPTTSMMPTILPGDCILCVRPFKPVSQLSRGTLITLQATAPITGAPIVRLNRLAGLPGDKIEIVNGELTVNGIRLPERGGEHCQPPRSNIPGLGNIPSYPFVVPEGRVFVLGDHYSNSLDSRYLGAFPMESVQRIALKRVRPLSRAGTVE